MTKLSTPRDVVVHGVTAFKRIEDRLAALDVDIARLTATFDAARAAGMCGTNQHRRILADVMVARGKAAEALSIIAALHIEGTAMAVAAGVDQVEAGGVVVPLGGGGR